MKRLLPRLNLENDRQMPLWPPDVFALCASVLQLSGAYSLIVHEDHAPREPWARQKYLESTAVHWEEAIRQWAADESAIGAKLPCTLSEQTAKKSAGLTELLQWWTVLMDHFHLPLTDLLKTPKYRDDDPAQSALPIEDLRAVMTGLFGLLAASDEISCRLDAAYSPKEDKGSFASEAEDFSYAKLARQQMSENHFLEERSRRASLCREIHPTRALVIPKVHTPRSGLTIRNLSNYLAYLRVADVRPTWFQFNIESPPAAMILNEHVNLLVVPWPDQVNPRQFRSVGSIPLGEDEGRSRMPQFGLFAYDMSGGPTHDHVAKLLKEAKEQVGQIDGLIFPETAMSRHEYDVIADKFFESDGHEADKFLVAGVGVPPPYSGDGLARFPADPVKPGGNEAVIDFRFKIDEAGFQNKRSPVLVKARYVQSKHHRWKLDRSQIVQYGLGSQLHPNVQWWEFIRSPERTIAFTELRPWLTTSVLVCEDLARPDPVGDALRAVGPNLIISLLCDGPQLQGRWPGRYATALADDPGSSVLTVTSLGMAKLSNPRGGDSPKSQCIALWKDAKNGVREISLTSGANAVILTLSPDYLPEYSADGRLRRETARSPFPILTGVLPISLPPHHSRP